MIMFGTVVVLRCFYCSRGVAAAAQVETDVAGEVDAAVASLSWALEMTAAKCSGS
jgi:hypothetical protein